MYGSNATAGGSCSRRRTLVRWNAISVIAAIVIASGAAGASAQGAPDALDLIADGTYVGTIDTTTAGFRDNATVTSSSFMVEKSGDTIGVTWAVVWDEQLIECMVTNVDSWGGSDVTVRESGAFNIMGIRVFDPEIESTCQASIGNIPAEYDRAFRFRLDGTTLSGDIGLGIASAEVALSTAVEPSIANSPGDPADPTASADSTASSESESTGNGGSLGIGIGLAAAIAIATLLVIWRSIRRSRESGEDDDSKSVSLELLYPAGSSPNVFTTGWTFGARCIVDAGGPNQQSLSDEVRWSGTGTFAPRVGATSVPTFTAAGANTITLSIEIDGKLIQETVGISAVDPSRYVSLGAIAHSPNDAHGALDCPHDVRGPIDTGSENVTVRGLPAARVGDGGFASPCCGANTFHVAEGDPSVLIDGRPAAMIGSVTNHCGGHGTVIAP